MRLKRYLTPANALVCALVLLVALVVQLRSNAGDSPQHRATPDESSRRVTLLTAFSIQDSARYQSAFAHFEKETGIEVILRAAGGDFADHVQVATPGFDPPDIGVFAQPGVFRELVAAGFVQPLPADLSAQAERDFPPFLDPVLRYQGRHYGIWARVAIKSLVWYRRALFSQYGFSVPRTDVELMALEQAMMRRGLTPWCVGVAARGATGWVATDWVEEFMLRQAGPMQYDMWVAGELPFSSGPVRAAFAAWDRMVRTPGLVAGGAQGILDTPVEEAARRFASDPPVCMMMRNSEWVTSEFPDSNAIGPNDPIDFFVLPGHDASTTELLVAGDVAAALNARPDTLRVLRYMASADFARRRAAVGAYLSAHADVLPNSYADPLSARLSTVWRRADLMRMDASDMMPGALGTAAFWNGAVQQLRGASVAEVTAGIDRSWRGWQVQQELARTTGAPDKDGASVQAKASTRVP